jgi:hypothetical protein
MQRIGDLIPEAARQLGLEDELRLARAGATWDAIVSERVPAAAGACRLVRLVGVTSAGGGVVEAVVETDHPIVAQELRMREPELVAALAAAPGGVRLTRLRITVRGP